MPVQDYDAATKLYVDNVATTGITFHEQVYVATVTTLETATGGTITYNQPNGAGNGVGATLTTSGTFYLIDTANIQTVGTRVLVQTQANGVQNGVYTYANTTAIIRSTDTDEYGADSTTQISINDYFFVTSGNVNSGAAFVVSSPPGTITFGTSNIQFAEFSRSQVYSANTSAGLSLTGTVFSAKVDNTTTSFAGSGNIVVKTTANLTTPNIGAASGTSLTTTGNIQANYFFGNGSQLTGIDSAAISNGTSNVQVFNSSNVTVSVASNANIATFATDGLSITGLVSSTGNVQGSNLITGGLASVTGNLIANNGMFTNIVNVASFTGELVSVSGNITGGNINTGGVVTATGNVRGGNVTTPGQMSATGNITTAGFFVGNFIGNVTGNIVVPGVNTQML
jgi:hypothetical protein